MNLPNNTPSSHIRLNEKQQRSFQHLASLLRRSAIEHLENFNNIHQDVMDAFTMSDEANRGIYIPILDMAVPTIPSKENEETLNKRFYKKLNNYPKADAWFWLSNRIFRSNIANKGNLTDEQQIEDMFDAQKEMSVANAILDNLIAQKNKKKGS